MSAQGVASRRQIENWILDGKVMVNGQLAELGMRITNQDKVSVNGKLVRLANAKKEKTRVLIYHKPEGEVVTARDPEGRKTVFQSIPKLKSGRWVTVGRLDINTTGLLIFTNDGELANRLMKPNYQIERKYAVRILGEVKDDDLKLLSKGIELEDGLAKFTSIEFAGGKGANAWYHVTLAEGRNREVRRMWESLGYRVSRLMRIAYGTVALPPRLRVGQWHYLDDKEVTQLKKSVDY